MTDAECFNEKWKIHSERVESLGWMPLTGGELNAAKWGWCEAKDDDLKKIEEIKKQRDKISALVTEWLCDKCNTVHPAPKGFDLSCNTAECDGLLRPSSPELRRVEAHRDKLLEALMMAMSFVEDHEDSDIYKSGSVKKVLGTIRAAITSIKGQS